MKMKKLSGYYDSYKPNNKSALGIANVNQLGSRGGGDVISYLPISIRSHIISFLPMKEGIKTTTLSTRWRNICCSLSNLDFDHKNFKNISIFKNFVNNMVALHDSLDVRRFSLVIDDDRHVISSDHIRAWIAFSIQHNVRDFSLEISFDSLKFELPLSFFSCSSTLSRLSLSYRDNLRWPEVIKFPMLKYLCVKGITFYDEEVTTTLFSVRGCPVLEELSICYCRFERIHKLSISFPRLKCLRLLCEDLPSVNLSIPFLYEVHCKCLFVPKMSCETFSATFHACFSFSMPDTISEEHTFSKSVKKILASLQKVETLSLSSDIIEILARDPNLLAGIPASYCSLEHLHLYIMPSKSHIEVIACLLRSSPNLKELDITIEMENSTSSDIMHRHRFWELNALSISDSLKHLKRVDIKQFVGRESEMEFVRHLLESTCMLEKMNICYALDKTKDAEKRMNITEELLSFRRVSPHATILFP